MEKSKFIGVWALVEFKMLISQSKNVIYPLGKHSVGYLIYTPDDYMSVHLMRANRLNCSNDDYRSTSIEEKIEMADNYGGYSGKYEVGNDMITHYPEVSVFPNFIHVPQIRRFRFYNHQLILEYPYSNLENENQSRSLLTWRRLSDYLQ